jgi:putative hydrolase of the HAD superfamily
MIRNIIFDLGNVLLSWKPGEFFERSGYGPEEVRIILKDIFKSNEWSMLDNGDITTSEAIDLIASGSSLKRDNICAIFDLRTKVIFPLVKNVKLLPELNKEGFKLYYLSNFPFDFFEEVKKQYDFFKYFNGGIISAEIGCSKPDTGIFKIFLENYNLTPEECLYIDDIEINVRVAESFGMKGIHLAGTDSLERKLMESGLRIASLRSQ